MKNVIDKQDKTAKRRRITIFMSLVMVIMATAFVVLLSRGVDRELYYISTTSQLRQQSEFLLLNIMDMNNAEHAFIDSRDMEQYNRFNASAREINRIILQLTLIASSHPELRDWVSQLSNETHARVNEMRRRMLIAQSLSRDNVTSLLAQTIQPLGSEKLNALITSFSGNTLNGAWRRTQLDRMRAGLSIASLATIISTFVLAYCIINRFRRDVEKLKINQRQLYHQNTKLEARVKERTTALENARNHAEKERQRVELLLQDTSHRIGNSLATVSSLLSLQANRTTDLEVRSALISARDRIQTIATAHRRLRLGTDMETSVIGEFLTAVVQDIELSIPLDGRERIKIETDFEFWCVSSRDATTLGIIAGELLTNAIKYAFPDNKSGTISIFFGEWTNDIISLVIEDDGIGLSEDIEGQKAPGLGHLVVKQLCVQFGGEPIYEKTKKGGTRVIIPLISIEETIRAHTDTNRQQCV